TNGNLEVLGRCHMTTLWTEMKEEERSLSSDAVRIERGTCYALFAYDVALSINLNEAERWMAATTQRESIRHKPPAPSSFEYRPATVRVTQNVETLTFGNYRSGTSVDLILYDFGAVSVIYPISLSGPLSGLLALSDVLYDNTALLADSRRRVEQLMTVIRRSLTKAELSELVEDYVI